MTLLIGSVSSSSLIDDARRTFSGATVPGKITNPRSGKIDNVSGIFGIWAGSTLPTAAPPIGWGPGPPPG